MSTTNRTYKRDQNKIHLSFEYNPSIIESLKEFDYKERKYNAISKQWTILCSVTNQNQIVELLEKYLFTPSEALSDQSNDESNIIAYLKKKSRLYQLKSFKTELDSIKCKMRPYPYQEVGIDTMCSWSQMINGDDCGTGKTVQTIFSAEITQRFPCLLVCPSSVKYQWEELWKKINPKRTVSIIEAKQKIKNWDADVVIINYDILGTKIVAEEDIEEEKPEWKAGSKYSELLSTKWEYVVLDEVHMLKNPKSLRSKSAELIVKKIPNRHGLTGTLVENRPSDLISPLRLIGVFDDVFGNWKTFTDRYCDAKDTEYGNDVSGASNTIELNRLLRETCYIRREKREVLKDLPPIQFSTHHIDLTNAREYRKAEDSFIDYLTENYSQIIVDSALMAEVLVQRNHLRQLSVQGKLKGIESWLKDFAEQSSEKVLIVGNYTKPLQQLSQNLSADIIDGSKDAKQKRDCINKWNKSKKQFLIGNIQAVGTGTDGLQDNCSVMVVIDLCDKASTYDQLVSRLERIGAKSTISIYQLLNRDTIDMKLLEAIEAKREVMKAVNSGIKLPPVDINKMIIQSYLSKK